MAIIKCPECGSDVSDAAPACPKCGHPIAAEAAKKKARIDADKRTKKNAITALVIIGIVALLAVAASNKPETDSSAASSTAPVEAPVEASKPVYETTAMQLFADYDTNEVAADNAMSGRTIRVKGRIQAIDKDFTDDVIVNFQTPNQFMPARMQMVDEEKPAAAQLRKGQNVEVECERMARVVGSPSGRKCHFVRQ